MTTTKVKRPIVNERIALQAIIDDEQSTPKQRLLARFGLYVFDWEGNLGKNDTPILSPSEKISQSLEKPQE